MMTNRFARDPEIAVRLQEVLQGGWPLRLAVLFGSTGSDRQRDESDVDIAIQPLDGSWDAAVECDLYVALARTARVHVHLVDIERAPQRSCCGRSRPRDGRCSNGGPANSPAFAPVRRPNTSTSHRPSPTTARSFGAG